METKSLVQMAVAVLVAIVVFVGVLVPVVSDAQTHTSTELNHSNTSTLFKMADSDDTVTISLSSGQITLNDTPVARTSNSSIILTDAISIDIFLYQGNWLTRAWYVDGTDLVYPSAFDLVFTDGTVTGTFVTSSGTDTIDMPYTYIYYVDATGDLTQVSSSMPIDYYVNSDKDLVISGLYYTGNNKTTYAYIDGELTVTGDYESTIDIVSEKITDDLYHVTGVTVNIGGESFTPYRFMIPAEVVGHEETANSTLIGVIPILVLVGLILGVIGFAISNRYDL